MRNRERLVLLLSVMLAVGVVGSLLFVFSSPASADDPPSETEGADVVPSEDNPDPATVEIEPARNQFELYPAGGNAIAYEDLDESEKAYLDNAALWAETEHGHGVHSKWAKASKEKRKRAKVKTASQLAGTQGLDELGVD